MAKHVSIATREPYFLPRKERPVRSRFGLDKISLILVGLYLLVPLGATLAFGLGGGFSIFQRIFSDPDLSTTLVTSLELAFGATLLAILLVTPTAYWVQLRIPRARPLLEFLSLVPFAVPAIVLAVGLLQEYSGTSNSLISILSLGLVPVLSNNLNIVNTPPLLICAYVIIALPFVYRPIDNSLRAINTTVLTEAAYSLGSGWWRTFLTSYLE
jgi:putative spermidine/putrescine transport system permease protein